MSWLRCISEKNAEVLLDLFSVLDCLLRSPPLSVFSQHKDEHIKQPLGQRGSCMYLPRDNAIFSALVVRPSRRVLCREKPRLPNSFSQFKQPLWPNLLSCTLARTASPRRRREGTQEPGGSQAAQMPSLACSVLY